MFLRLLPYLSSVPLLLLGSRRSRRETSTASLVTYRLGPPGGEPWVLLHGLASTAASWLPVIGPLRRDCRLLLPELSSHGGTRGEGPGLDVREGVRAVAELIRSEFPGRKVTVAGISLGGWMAMRLALDHPDLVDRLLLVDAGGYREQDWDRIRSLVEVSGIEDIDPLYRAFFVRAPWYLRLSRRLFYRAYSSPAVRHVLDSLSEDDVFDDEDLASIEAPVGLIWGKRDGLFQPQVAHAMAAALPRSQVFIISGSAHGIQWERPRALAAAARAFRDSTHPTSPSPDSGSATPNTLSQDAEDD